MTIDDILLQESTKFWEQCLANCPASMPELELLSMRECQFENYPGNPINNLRVTLQKIRARKVYIYTVGIEKLATKEERAEGIIKDKPVHIFAVADADYAKKLYYGAIELLSGRH